jgi:hypothetical protein
MVLVDDVVSYRGAPEGDVAAEVAAFTNVEPVGEVSGERRDVIDVVAYPGSTTHWQVEAIRGENSETLQGSWWERVSRPRRGRRAAWGAEGLPTHQQCATELRQGTFPYRRLIHGARP